MGSEMCIRDSFDPQSILVAVPSFERPLVPPSGTIAGIPIRMSPQPSLWTPSLSIGSTDSSTGLELEVKQGDKSEKCATGPGYRPEWPNLNYSPISEGSGIVSRPSGNPDMVDCFIVSGSEGRSIARGVYGAWSAFAGVAFLVEPKGSRLVNIATGKGMGWKSKGRAAWIPGTESALLFELGSESTTAVVVTFAKK